MREAAQALTLALRADPAARTPGRGALRDEGAPATERLYERLSSDVLARVDAHLERDSAVIEVPDSPGIAPKVVPARDLWTAAQGVERQRLTLIFGVAFDIPGVLEATGLSRAQPPEDVHQMGRGPLAAGGSFYHADLVAAAFRGAGAAPAAGQRFLDFGCSSGRVVRVLAAAYPAATWEGCDPIRESVAWAAANLAPVRFWSSPQSPPLDVPPVSFDGVFAISVWSHYSERAAREWLTEMHRVLRPGGHLVLTTHGYDSLAYLARRRLRSRAALMSVREDLYLNGFAFLDTFGEAGDWGIVSPDWGDAFISAEWLLAKAPQFDVVDFAGGRNEGNQDVWVLRRETGQ
jgi:SAM-dependent methyltransferase